MQQMQVRVQQQLMQQQYAAQQHQVQQQLMQQHLQQQQLFQLNQTFQNNQAFQQNQVQQFQQQFSAGTMSSEFRMNSPMITMTPSDIQVEYARTSGNPRRRSSTGNSRRG
jgi:hypothetical protein